MPRDLEFKALRKHMKWEEPKDGYFAATEVETQFSKSSAA